MDHSDGIAGVVVAMLSFLAAAITIVIYVGFGRWPAELGGAAVIIFLLLGLGLLGVRYVDGFEHPF